MKLKFTEFLMPFFKQKVSFSSNSSVLFQLELYMLLTKVAHQSTNFQTSIAPIKIHQIPHAIFQTKSQFFFKLLCTFSAGTLYAVDKSRTSKYKFSDLLLLPLKFTKFLLSFLDPRVSFSSNFASVFSVTLRYFFI